MEENELDSLVEMLTSDNLDDVRLGHVIAVKLYPSDKVNLVKQLLKTDKWYLENLMHDDWYITRSINKDSFSILIDEKHFIDQGRWKTR